MIFFTINFMFNKPRICIVFIITCIPQLIYVQSPEQVSHLLIEELRNPTEYVQFVQFNELMMCYQPQSDWQVSSSRFYYSSLPPRCAKMWSCFRQLLGSTKILLCFTNHVSLHLLIQLYVIRFNTSYQVFCRINTF